MTVGYESLVYCQTVGCLSLAHELADITSSDVGREVFYATAHPSDQVSSPIQTTVNDVISSLTDNVRAELITTSLPPTYEMPCSINIHSELWGQVMIAVKDHVWGGVDGSLQSAVLNHLLDMELGRER